MLFLFALVIFCTILVSGHLLTFLYLPAHVSKWKSILNQAFFPASVSVFVFYFSTVIPLTMWTRTGHIYPFISSFDIYVHINTAVRKFNISYIRYPFRTKVQPYLKTTHGRICDKGLHMYKGTQAGAVQVTPCSGFFQAHHSPSSQSQGHKGRWEPIENERKGAFSQVP